MGGGGGALGQGCAGAAQGLRRGCGAHGEKLLRAGAAPVRAVRAQAQEAPPLRPAFLPPG